MIQALLEGDYYGGGNSINNQERAGTLQVYDGSGTYDGNANTEPTPSAPQVLVKKPFEAPIAQVSEPVALPVSEPIASPISQPVALPVENLGSSNIHPNPIDTLPVKVPIAQVAEPMPTATPIVNIPTTEPITKEAITVPKEEATSNIAPKPVDTVTKTTLNIIPLAMPSLSPASGGGSSDSINKTNPTYWLYVIAGAVVLSYFLLKGKSKQN
jgi:hypothetical protein